MRADKRQRRDGSRAPRGSRFFPRAHVRLYRATGGIIGHWLGRQRCLLLTTTGRKTGRSHTQPLSYYQLDGRIYVVASNWGSDHPPAWYLNLSAQTRVSVQLKRERWEALAGSVPPEEHARLWPRLVARNPIFARYQEASAREIPVVVLWPSL
jgi:F420H(2)-dependent quinone reductase